MLFGLLALGALLFAVLMPSTTDAERDVTDLALGVVFLSLFVGFAGCAVVLRANDGLSLINLISVMLMWTIGSLMTAFFLTFVFTDPPPEREYMIGTICGLPSLFLAVMGILLYRHEARQAAADSFAGVDELKEDRPNVIATRLALLLGLLLVVIFIFDVWVAVTTPFPH